MACQSLRLTTLLFLCLLCTHHNATITVPSFISDSMVLRQHIKVPVLDRAASEEELSLNFMSHIELSNLQEFIED